MEENTSPTISLSSSLTSTPTSFIVPPVRSSSATRLNLNDTIKTHTEAVKVITDEALDRASRLVRVDMLSNTDDYKLLETLNHIARDRFAEMGDSEGVLGVVLRSEAEELKNLRTYLKVGSWMTGLNIFCLVPSTTHIKPVPLSFTTHSYQSHLTAIPLVFHRRRPRTICSPSI